MESGGDDDTETSAWSAYSHIRAILSPLRYESVSYRRRMGSEVHLDIYDDRLAITSPGGMYSGQTVQDLPIEEISSDRRNPILADVMAQLDYMEKRGSGLKRIYNEPQIRNL